MDRCKIGLGEPNTRFWRDTVYASSNEILGDADDVALRSVYISNSLPTTASYHVEQPMVEVPFDLSGTLRLFVVTNDGDIVDENGLKSNNLALLGTIDVDLLRTQPDLLVHQVNAPIESISGQSFDLTWSVRNLGDFIPQGRATGSELVMD